MSEDGEAAPPSGYQSLADRGIGGGDEPFCSGSPGELLGTYRDMKGRSTCIPQAAVTSALRDILIIPKRRAACMSKMASEPTPLWRRLAAGGDTAEEWSLGAMLQNYMARVHAPALMKRGVQGDLHAI